MRRVSFEFCEKVILFVIDGKICNGKIKGLAIQYIFTTVLKTVVKYVFNTFFTTVLKTVVENVWNHMPDINVIYQCQIEMSNIGCNLKYKRQI